jgi:hypothetical protein
VLVAALLLGKVDQNINKVTGRRPQVARARRAVS